MRCSASCGRSGARHDVGQVRQSRIGRGPCKSDAPARSDRWQREHAERARSASGRDPCAPPFADRTRSSKACRLDGLTRLSTATHIESESRAGACGLGSPVVSGRMGRAVEGALTRCRRQGLESRYRTSVRINSMVTGQQVGHRVSVVGWCRAARVGREWSWVVMSGLDVSEGDVSWCVGSVTLSRCGFAVEWQGDSRGRRAPDGGDGRPCRASRPVGPPARGETRQGGSSRVVPGRRWPGGSERGAGLRPGPAGGVHLAWPALRRARRARHLAGTAGVVARGARR